MSDRPDPTPAPAARNASRAEHIRRLTATAPALTPAQIAKLRALLPPVEPDDQDDR